MRCLASSVVWLLVAWQPLTAIAAHRITVQCDQPALVAGQRLWIVRHDPPLPRQNTRVLLNTAPRFDQQGKCELQVDDGDYRFDVLARNGSTFLALTTGVTQINSDTQLNLQASHPARLRVLYQNRDLPLEQVMFRIAGTRNGETWSGQPQGDVQAVLSPGQEFPIRLVARDRSQAAAVQAALWLPLSAETATVDLSQSASYRVKFAWQGDRAELKQVKNPIATLYFPEQDELELPIEPGTTFLTNRRLIELSFRYDTPAGEQLVFNRRSYVLSPRHTVPWGGTLSAAAYARVTMKWGKPGHSLLWGAYLYNAAGDVVSSNEFPVEKPHRRHPTGHPNYLKFRQPYSRIEWQQTLHRVDKGPIPHDLENITERDLERIGDPNRMHENFLVAVSYQLNGQTVQENVPLTQFVTWKSKRISLEAPRHWHDRAAAYLDKTERVFDICVPMARYTPEFIQLFWTNNYGAGYTIGPQSKKRVQMGFFDLRDRKGLFGRPDILVHEMLHAFGYVHGREHDAAIRQGRKIFDQHRIYLADHADYAPYPIENLNSIEDTRNHGAGDYNRFTRINVPGKPARRGNLGAFRGHTPHVQSEQDVLEELLALRDAAPPPAEWDGARDLLESVDPVRHAVNGDWNKLKGQLVSPQKNYARVQLSSTAPASYQLELQFTRVHGDGLAVMLPVDKTSVSLIVSGWDGKVSGLAFVEGRDADRNATTRDGKLPNGQKHTLRASVQLLPDDRARIGIELNGKPYIEWQGPRSALKPDRQWSLRDTDALGIGAYDAQVVIHHCQLRKLNNAKQ